MGVPGSKLDRHIPLTEHGLDSLMVFSLNNRVKAELGIALPIERYLGGASIAELAKDALQQLLVSLLTGAAAASETDGDWEVLAI